MSEPVKDPIVLEAIKAAKRAEVTRRAVLGGAGAAGLTALLAACAPGGAKKTLKAAKDLSDTEKTLAWDNWPYYIDGEDGSFPTIKAFEAKSGIKVDYKISVDDNNTYFAAIKNQLAAGSATGADTFCLTDWMVSRLIKNGYVQELNYDNMPNVTANLIPAFKNELGAFDPGRKYSLPWKGIIAGIGYHKENYKKLTGKDAPTSLDDLWAPELKGKVEVLAEMRDTLGIMMMAAGVDPQNFTSDDFYNALDLFSAKVADGQIRSIKGNSYVDDYKSGDAVAGIVWAGDLVGANIELGSDVLGVVLLESGSTFATDNFVVPMGSAHKKNVETIIDYYFDPVVAAEVALSGVFYVPPVAGVREEVIKKDPALASNELIFPSEEVFATRLKQLRPLTAKEDNEFSKAWSDASSGVA